MACTWARWFRASKAAQATAVAGISGTISSERNCGCIDIGKSGSSSSKQPIVSGSRGKCAVSGIRFYASRSRPAPESSCCFATVERLHQYAVLDGVTGGQLAGGHCARLCASWLPRLVSGAFQEGLQQLSPSAASVVDVPEEAVISTWAQALMSGFSRCDQLAAQEDQSGEGSCGALLCVVARSGIYVASIGVGMAVIGTLDSDGETIWCDEASIPHNMANEAEADRWGEPRPPDGVPTRLLGGSSAKRIETRLLGLPDVVRHEHGDAQRFVILGSPQVWSFGPRLPLQWAMEAQHAGRNPADEIVIRSQGRDAVALVLVLPGGLGSDDSPLPKHGELVSPIAAAF